MMARAFSEACVRNRDPILTVIRPLLADSRAVLEIGSGTGQHAVHFARAMPHLVWYTSDLQVHHAGISDWLGEVALDNVRGPLLLDVRQSEWPDMTVDAVFSANTAHIMSQPEVNQMLTGVSALLPASGYFMLYGPFNYDNQYTSDSNRRFDSQLRHRDPDSGIRHFEDLDALAGELNLYLQEDHAMPANNRLLVWQKR